MAKASINTGVDAQAVHTRTTAGVEESQVVVLGIDGSDGVVSATVADGLMVDLGANNDVRGQTLVVSGSGAALNDIVIPSTDALHHPNVSVQFTGADAWSARFHVSNDNVNWMPVNLCNVFSLEHWDDFSTENGAFYGPIPGRYFRVVLESHTSGTCSAVAVFRSYPMAVHMHSGTRIYGSSGNPISPDGAGSDNSAPDIEGLWTQARLFVYDGTNFDRVRGDSTRGLDVNITNDPVAVLAAQGGSGEDPWVVAPQLATAAAVTSVNDSAASQTLLSASALRRGFRIFNDSTSALHVKYGATATTTDFTEKIAAAGMLREDNYQGRVDGIWAADSSGAARITELT